VLIRRRRSDVRAATGRGDRDRGKCEGVFQ
jgi:hypothetical protein